MSKLTRWPRWAVALIVLVCCFEVTGCEPLRKKFIRQKKEQTREVIPVLEPIDYPEKVETAEEIFVRHIGLWRVWQKEAMTDISEGSSDKRIRDDLSRMQTSLERMKELLNADRQQLVQTYIDRLGKVQSAIGRPAQFRNRSTLLQDLRILDKDVRANLKFETVKDELDSGLAR